MYDFISSLTASTKCVTKQVSEIKKLAREHADKISLKYAKQI